MAELLSGKEMAARLELQHQGRVKVLKSNGVTPSLAVILVGCDPASEVYVRNKAAACGRIGISSSVIRLDENTSQENLENTIRELAADKLIHGILLQLPLPRHLNADRAINLIPPEKDVDGLGIMNCGLLLNGMSGLQPCTARGAVYMIKETGVPLSGKHAVIIGRSRLVGKPLAQMLLQENCTVTVCHSKTADLAAMTRQADILVAAVGHPGLVTADMVKPGAIVIDVGINRIPCENGTRLVGDVDFDAVSRIAGWITPVPGGVGKMTISMLMDNTLLTAERTAAHGLDA